MMEKLKNRHNILAVFFVFFAAVILLQLANLQIIEGEKWQEDSQTKMEKSIKEEASRGNIADRNGVPIAVNRMGFTVEIIKTEISNGELNKMILEMIKVFDKNGDSYISDLDRYLAINPIDYGDGIKDSIDKIEKWKSEMAYRGDLELLKTPKDVFDYFRNKKFYISEEYSDEEAYKIMEIRYEMLIRGYTNLLELLLAEDVSQKTIAELEERRHEFPGVITGVKPYRKYIDAENVTHVLGFIGTINSQEYEKLKDKGYNYNDLIGKDGIELIAEDELRGKNGRKKVSVDTMGRVTSVLGGTSAVPGNDVVLTIDTRLQRVALESLEKNINEIRQNPDYKKNFGDADAGAAVAMDVNTGEVLVLASYPTYDPAIYLGEPNPKEANRKIVELIQGKDERKPAINRAIAGRYEPGSTFKPITAIAALEEGIITPDTIINDKGKTNIGGKDFFCLEYKWGHGNLDLEKALETSCNIYFHKIGEMTTISNISKWASYFGLGERTGIDLPGEIKGILASRESKPIHHPDDTMWRPADTALAAIGQHDNGFSPLQMVNYMSALANGGKKLVPHLIKRVIASDGTILKETKPEYEMIPVKEETIDAIKEGMVAVTTGEEGTAARVFKDFPFEVAGKTGTAETGKEDRQSSNALFVCYAPADDPQIAVAVVVEKGVWGSNTAPIARDILEAYFGLDGSAKFDEKVQSDQVMFTP